MYELYTFPNCCKCQEIKEMMKKNGIAYNEIDVGNGEGRKLVGKLYITNREKMQLDEKKMVILPILVKRNDSGIEAIAQSVDSAKILLGV